MCTGKTLKQMKYMNLKQEVSNYIRVSHCCEQISERSSLRGKKFLLALSPEAVCYSGRYDSHHSRELGQPMVAWTWRSKAGPGAGPDYNPQNLLQWPLSPTKALLRFPYSPKQCHKLGTRHSNTRASGAYLWGRSFTLRSYPSSTSLINRC